MTRGPKKHLKRLNAPSHWMLDKLGGIFVGHLPVAMLCSLPLNARGGVEKMCICNGPCNAVSSTPVQQNNNKSPRWCNS